MISLLSRERPNTFPETEDSNEQKRSATEIFSPQLTRSAGADRPWCLQYETQVYKPQSC